MLEQDKLECICPYVYCSTLTWCKDPAYGKTAPAQGIHFALHNERPNYHLLWNVTSQILNNLGFYLVVCHTVCIFPRCVWKCRWIGAEIRLYASETVYNKRHLRYTYWCHFFFVALLTAFSVGISNASGAWFLTFIRDVQLKLQKVKMQSGLLIGLRQSKCCYVLNYCINGLVKLLIR